MTAVAEADRRSIPTERPQRPEITEAEAIELVRRNIDHVRSGKRISLKDGIFKGTYPWIVLFAADGEDHAYIDPIGQYAKDCPIADKDAARNHTEHHLSGSSAGFRFAEVVFPELMREAGVDLSRFVERTEDVEWGEKRIRVYTMTRDRLVFESTTYGTTISTMPNLGFVSLLTRNLVRKV